jgi:hypothetical protein
MTRKEDASLYFADGFNCSQAVFTAFGKEKGLTEDQCLQIGCAFCEEKKNPHLVSASASKN